jgi:hypothetical protein
LEKLDIPYEAMVRLGIDTGMSPHSPAKTGGSGGATSVSRRLVCCHGVGVVARQGNVNPPTAVAW